MFENYPEESANLSSNHQNKFENKLMKELHQKESKPQTWKWLSIAASLALLVSIAIQFYPVDLPNETEIEKKTDNKIRLGTISPDLNTVETYYTNSINLALSELEPTEENKEILDGYLVKIGQLTTEYKSLTTELNTKGVNDEIINALINNLQLRLQLLQRLKKQLNDLKQLNLTKNETQNL
tara:strand:- start:52825 stop:53370 length:546 start_codon:yes stop_codon:yes gene_type:complete